MSFFQTYPVGVAVAHVFWFYSFTTGHLLRPKALEESRSFSLSDLVITSVAGMALAGFCLLFLGFARLLNPAGISVALLFEGILFLWLRGDNWFSWSFWGGMLRRFIKAWTIPAFFIYLLLLILGMPAALPPTFADSVTYHLPYAVDWANAGRIYVDPFLRFPFYANNFLLFYSALFVLKLGSYCHFLNWLCGLLTCLGVLAFFTPVEDQLRESTPGWKLCRPQQFLIPLCVALSPTFLRFLNVAYIDVPIGLFVLVSILCAYRTTPSRPFARELVVTGAFCAGMKLTLIGYLPFFLASLAFACRCRLRRREIVILSLLLVVLSLPWYVRNMIEAHDPTPPIFNSYFKHPDPIYTQSEAAIYTVDTMTERNPRHFVLLPFRFFTDPESQNFREWGVTAMILLLYAPVLFLVAQFCWRNRWRVPGRLIYLSVAVVYLTFPWLFSSLGRYSLHWYPTLAAWVGVIVSHICARTENLWNSRLAIWIGRSAAAVFCGFLIIPTPSEGCKRFYSEYQAMIKSLFQSTDNLQVLKKNVTGYSASQAAIVTLVSNQKSNTRVLLDSDCGGLSFYFRKARIISVGDYFGPGRWWLLYKEIEEGNCLPYLTQLDISAVIVRPHKKEKWWPGLYDKFRFQLKDYGFREYRTSEDNVAIFLRSDIAPGHELTPLTE